MKPARGRATSFGGELGRLLAAQGVTYRELSLRTGLAHETLRRYALGLRRPSDEVLELIAAALEVEPEQLLEYRRRRVDERLGEEPRLVDALYVRFVRHR